MRQILNVAEKNAVAKEMSKILSKGNYNNVKNMRKMTIKIRYHL